MTTVSACPRCGTEIVAGNKYCSECGTDVTGQTGLDATRRMTSVNPEHTLVELLREATVGEFEILKELGRGGMAMVFLAHDLSLNRKVALKVMSPSLGSDESMAERFVREAQTAASLSHPNIIPVYAVKHHELVTFFVMKFIPGRPLDDIMGELGPMPSEMVSAILQQVGAALGYGHRRGVVHRDVKPGNVMIDEEGWAIVTDFGIAKVDTAEGLTRTGAAIGTPTYMSPEQCTAKEVTGSSDQYSLGVVAYEMLTGRKPFEGESVMAIMYGHVHEELPDLKMIRPDCPPTLYAAINRMLAKDPTDRFASMDDLVSALGAATLTHDHPVRTQMMTLAAEGLSAKLLQQVATPRSPIPRAKTPPPSGPSTARPQTPPVSTAADRTELTASPTRPGTLVGRPKKAESRKGLILGVGGLVAVVAAAVVFVLAPWRAPETPAGTPPSNSEATTPVAASEAARIAISPESGTLEVGEALNFSATVFDQTNAAMASATVGWTSENDRVASVSPSGAVTATGVGTVNIVATAGGIRRTVSLTVEAALPPTPPTVRVTSVSVDPSTVSLIEGESQLLRTTVGGSNGRNVNGRTESWRSSNQSVVTVSSSGQVSARGPGSATVSVTVEGQSANVSVTVTPEPVASINVTPPTQTLDAGQETTFSAQLLSPRGNVISGREVSWTSTNTSVARVSATGVVSAVGEGEANIEASYGDRRGTATVRVRAVVVEPTGPSSAESRAQITQLIMDWKTALESRNVNNLRRAYPGMSAAEVSSWTDFLESVRSITVQVDVTSVAIEANTATANVSARYDYTLRSGGPQTQEPQLVARFALEGSQWRLTSIR